MSYGRNIINNGKFRYSIINFQKDFLYEDMRLYFFEPVLQSRLIFK